MKKRLVAFSWILVLGCRIGFAAGALEGRVIVLDPGHAVKNALGEIINPGKPGPTGLEERDVALEISELLGQKLEAAGAQVHFTRTRENFWRTAEAPEVDNWNRAVFANSLKADAFLKIHLDWSYKRARTVQGSHVYYFTPESRPLAEAIQSEIVRSTQRRNRGIRRDYFVGMIVAEMPTVLIESAFISNPQEERLLRDPKFLDKIASGIARGLERFFEASPRPAPSVPAVEEKLDEVDSEEHEQ